MIRKVTSIVLCIVVIFMVSSTSHAQLRRDRDYYVGRILEVYDENRSVLFRDRSGMERVFSVENGWENVSKDIKVAVSVQRGTDIVKTLKPAAR